MNLRKGFSMGWVICVMVIYSISVSATRWIPVFNRCGSIKFDEDGISIVLRASLNHGMHLLGYQNAFYVNTFQYPYGKTYAALSKRLQENDLFIPTLKRGPKSRALESIRWDYVLHHIPQAMTWHTSALNADNVMWSFGLKGRSRIEMPESYMFRAIQFQAPPLQGLFVPRLRMTRDDLDFSLTPDHPCTGSSSVQIRVTPGVNHRFKIECHDDEWIRG